MGDARVIYVVGAGAVGMALAACLIRGGREAIAVRTRNDQALRETIRVSLHYGADRIEVLVESVGLGRLASLDGVVAVTAKSYANGAIAPQVAEKMTTGSIVVIQNGVGVEKPFLEARLHEVYRCVLYLTSQRTSENEFSFHPIRSSPIGIVRGNEAGLDSMVAALTTDRFPFHAESNIQREIWKKAVVNAVLNSICPLLEVDNGIFFRDQAVAELANEVITECLQLTDKLALGLTRAELMAQIMQISKSSDGQIISTLQDIRDGRETEIEFLNLEIARTAAAQQPPISLPKTELLGKLTLAKSKQRAGG